MESSHNHPNRKGHHEDTTFFTQLDAVYQAFFEKPRTMKEADFASGVMRESICRYVRTLRNQGRIYRLKQRRCECTNHKAGEYTTDPRLFPKTKPQQLNLFNHGI